MNVGRRKLYLSVRQAAKDFSDRLYPLGKSCGIHKPFVRISEMSMLPADRLADRRLSDPGILPMRLQTAMLVPYEHNKNPIVRRQCVAVPL